MAEKAPLNIEELLAKAEKPSADAMLMHPFYKGKVEIALKSCVRDFDDFAIWYTPGVAAPCRAIGHRSVSDRFPFGCRCFHQHRRPLQSRQR